MANPTYPWNPFQERIDCRITDEVLKTSGDNDRRVFVPRAAPFFSGGATGTVNKKFVIKRQGSGAVLTPGVDYAFAHSFDRFIQKYMRNCFGAIVLLKPFPDEVLLVSYDTIGGPFILDEVAWATLVANIANSPRVVDWADLINVPFDFPADPHEHPETQTYDWLENYTALKSLIMIITDTSSTTNALKLLEEHMEKNLPEAHPASKSDLGIPDVANNRSSTNEDLAGQSSNVNLTMQTFKEGLRQLRDGTLKLD